MFHIILFEPEIPPNTGNIIRLCANTGCQLHLIAPLGFEINDKQLKRAGLDYHLQVNMQIYPSWPDCQKQLKGQRLFALSSKGKTGYTIPTFQPGDAFLFGPESRGLPQPVLDSFPSAQQLRLPQVTTSRSLNLANAAAVMVYEAWRQCGFQV